MNIDRTLSIFLTCIILVGIIAVVYIILNPFQGEKFTEFYILGSEGKAGNYPTNLNQGDIGNITVGVVNKEQATINYLMVIKESNQTLKSENFTLNDGEKKELPFNFTAESNGQQKIEFNLYKLPDTNKVYRYLFLVVNIN